MSGADDRNWWESLRHFGLLLSPDVVARVGTDFAPPDLLWYRVDQLRRELNRRESGDIDAGQFVAWVLDNLCGFAGRDGAWTRGSNVSPEWGQTLVTGEGHKPRHVWQAHRGGALPVFFDNAKVLGQGRGRKAISDCAQWLRKARQPLALVTNGRQWRLLYAGLDFEAACEWDTELWFEEGEPGPQLQALRTLLQPALLVSAAKDGPTPLVTAIQDSRKGQSELSAFLGERVREAVEALVRAHGPALSRTAGDLDGADIYRAAVRIVMRMVVVLFAESRELLPRTEPTYENGYGLQGLFEALQRVAVRGRSRLGHRFGAWPRVLALFRLIHDGADHPDLGVPAYGGELFAPGNPEDADPVNRALAVFESSCFDPQLGLMPDVIVHEMLELLTRTQVRVRQGRATTRTVVPVDFAGLSTEYIGVLYEGLLDYELRAAPEDDPIVFLAVGNEPALPLSALEAMEERQIRQLFEALKDTSKAGDEADDETAGEPADIDGEDEATGEEDEGDLGDEGSSAEDPQEDEVSSTEATRQRALTWTRQAAVAAGLVKKPKGKQTPEKQQVFEQQLDAKARQLARRVVQPGEWFLVRWGGTRKGAGTFYTRPQLAVPTVHRTLRPLVFDPPALDGAPDTDAPAEQWATKKPEEILAVKVCDPGCGSGSFLVAAARFLTDALYTSLHEHGRLVGDGWRTSVDELLGLAVASADDDESLDALRLPAPPDAIDFEPRTKAILRRYVVERCIYGVDLDPLAVELCRLALWLETMDRDLPFSFLDHKVKCGNSLVGTWFDQFRHYPAMAWKNREGGDKTHNNGVHFGKDERGKALKTFVKETLQPDFVESMTGQWKLGERPAGEDAATVHDDMVDVLQSLHTMPVHSAAEQARRYREEFQGSEAWQKLKTAFDLWCACWYWPEEELDVAPLPSQFGHPNEPTCAIATRVAARQRFFHWELEFPDVYGVEASGFDAVLGNPPWDVAKPNSREFFSNIDPLYRSYGKQEALRKQTDFFSDESVERAWLDYSADFRSQSNLFKYAAFAYGDPATADSSGDRFALARGGQNTEMHTDWRIARAKSKGYADAEHAFRHQGSADVNLYKLFLEQAHALLRKGGRLGFIVPSGLYSDHGTGDLRELFLERCNWEWLFGFENREGIFDIHRSFKFNSIIVQKGGTTEAIRAAFMRRRLDDWESAEEHVTPYARRQVERFSPKSRSILEIQSSRDLEILEKIYANSVLLGDDGPDGWGIKYATEFHMTNDSSLFPPRPQWEEKGYKPDEYSRWLKGEWKARTPTCPAPPGAKRVDIREGIILSRDGEEWIDEERVDDVALPLYEGRMIGQFDFSQKGWVSGKGRTAVWDEIPFGAKHISPQFCMGKENYLSSRAPRDAGDLKLAFMDVASSTNSRTMTASLTAGNPAGNKTPLLLPRRSADAVSLVGILNSFVYDYLLRLRFGGLSLNYFILEETQLPRPESTTAFAQAVLPLAAADESFATLWLRTPERGQPWKGLWALTRAERLRRTCIVNALVAENYGIDEDAMRWVLKDTDSSAESPLGALSAKGFWRIDKANRPEHRETVLSFIAFLDLQCQLSRTPNRDGAIAKFSASDGWMLPDTVTLAEYGLGHDESARRPQVVADHFGPRFHEWQLEQEPGESWKECELHARNLLGEEGYMDLRIEIEAEAEGDAIVGPTRGIPTGEKPLSTLVQEAGDQFEMSFSEAGSGSQTSSEEWTTDEIMCLFRKACRQGGTMTRERLLKDVSQEMGYQRLGRNIDTILRNHLRAAIRRAIIASDGDFVCLAAKSMADYTNDHIESVVGSVAPKGRAFEEADVIRSVASYLGFQRLTDGITTPIKRAITRMIRAGSVERDGSRVTKVN